MYAVRALSCMASIWAKVLQACSSALCGATWVTAARTPWVHYVFDFEFIFGCWTFRGLLLFSNILGSSHSVIRAHIGAQISTYGAAFLFFLSENFPLRCVAIILGAKVPSAEIIVNLSVRVNCKFSVPAEKPCTRPSCFHFCRADNIVSPLCTAHGPHVCSSQLASTCTFPIQFKRILKFNF